MRKWLISLMALVGLAVGIIVSVPAAHAATPNYTITTDTTFPPFEFQTDGGKYRGIDMDMLKEISKRENFTYTLKPMSFNAGVQAVQADKWMVSLLVCQLQMSVKVLLILEHHTIRVVL